MIKKYFKYYFLDAITLIFKELQLTFSSEKPILVFSMGKVGSLSVYFALKKYWQYPVFHIHSLDEDEQKMYDRQCFEKGILPGSRSAIPMINRRILKKKRPFKIITLVRNPVERNISAFFEAFEYYVGIPAEKYKGTMHDLEIIYHQKMAHQYPNNWFTSHFYKQTGINIYDFAFSKVEKYQVFKHTNIEVLVLDVALADAEKEKQIEFFCGKKNIRIERKNVRETTSSAELYKKFKETIIFEKSYLDMLLETPYFNHFFDSNEKVKTERRWLKK
ncbi:putative capsular polysaccharide synthesis family protein [Emticicia sp. SJ17W-69]|uniref:putative capsular polysaccharide synthesis family protein n=1 Tax=Emticicia sp. SJ17W-69 TaxID=3421657 RepID=UPI003EBEF735